MEFISRKDAKAQSMLTLRLLFLFFAALRENYPY